MDEERIYNKLDSIDEKLNGVVSKTDVNASKITFLGAQIASLWFVALAAAGWLVQKAFEGIKP